MRYGKLCRSNPQSKIYHNSDDAYLESENINILIYLFPTQKWFKFKIKESGLENNGCSEWMLVYTEIKIYGKFCV